MTTLIKWVSDNREWFRWVVFASGWVGLWIMKAHTRPSFYCNRSKGWWVLVVGVYSVLGPLMLVVSLITLCNPEPHKDRAGCD